MVNARFSKVLWFYRIGSIVLAIHLLNFSIDPRDATPRYVPENLSVNDIESITEFLCEEVFQLANTFEETDDADDDSENIGGSILKIYFSNPCVDVQPALVTSYCVYYPTTNKTGHDLFKSEITIPPPKVA